MKNKILVLLGVLSVLFIVSFTSKPVFGEENYIQDNISLLSKDEYTDINNILNKFSLSTELRPVSSKEELVNSQFAIYITDTLKGQDIESFSKNLFNEKQIGDKKHNKGILLVLAKDDHKYRIQLGDGWYGTDLNEDNINSYVYTDGLTSMLRDDNYSGAIKSMVINTIGLSGTSIKLDKSLNSWSEAWIANKEKEEAKRAELSKAVKKFFTVIISTILGVTGLALLFKVIKLSIKAYKLNLRKKDALSSLELDMAFDPDIELIRSNSHLTDNEIVEAFLKSEHQAFKSWKDEKAKDIKAKIKEAEELKKRQKEEAERKRLYQLQQEKKRQKLYSILDLPKVKSLLSGNKEEVFSELFNSSVPIEEESVIRFLEEYNHNKSLIDKANYENSKYFDSSQQALSLTRQQYYQNKDNTSSNIIETLMMYQLLSNNFHNHLWYSSPEYAHIQEEKRIEAERRRVEEQHRAEEQRREQERLDEQRRQDSYNSSSSSSWSDFGGGGGFSSGGGASGGW